MVLDALREKSTDVSVGGCLIYNFLPGERERGRIEGWAGIRRAGSWIRDKTIVESCALDKEGYVH